MKILRASLVCCLLLSAAAGPATATFPGYNGRIAFGCDDDICLVNVDGSAVERLVSGYGPAWSPDGRHLAFARGYGDVFVLNADGKGLRQVLESPAGERGLFSIHSLTWSRDGKRLMFALSGKLTVLNVATEEHEEIGDAGELNYAWSPDERRIAFNRRVPTACAGGPAFRNGCVPDQPELWVMNSDGTGPGRYAGPTSGSRPDWSPDGQRILYAGYPHGVRAIGADGTPLAQPALETGDNASWSPDGTKIVFVNPEAYIQVLDADGQGTPTTITGPWGFSGKPTWQPLAEIASLTAPRRVDRGRALDRGLRATVSCAQRCQIVASLRAAGRALTRPVSTTAPTTGSRTIVFRPRSAGGRYWRLRTEVVDVAGNRAILKRRIRLR